MGALLVDLDDTLIPDRAARDEAMTAALAPSGGAAPIELAAAWSLIRDAWRSSGLRTQPALAGVSSWEALWTDLDAVLGEPSARSSGRRYQADVWRRLAPGQDAATVSKAFRCAREELVRPFSWVPPVLAAWAASHTLWCVTNGSSWLQRRKLELSGLQPYFSHVVISGEVGAEKSDLRFHYELAHRLAQAELVPVAVVGDSTASDGTIATALGVPFVAAQPGTRLTAGAIQWGDGPPS